MKIIISPTKKMKAKDEGPGRLTEPVFLKETEKILRALKEKNYEELKELWQCSDKLATENYHILEEMDLNRNLSAAILTYEGLVFKHMAPMVFTEEMYAYVNEHLRILSGFYGILKPFDGITPYRLEMQAELSVAGSKNLYDFWGDKLYRELSKEKGQLIINLASEEYSKIIEKYLKPEDIMLNVIFGEVKKNKAGETQLDKSGNPKIVTKATYAKMARGAMVRYMAENQVENIESLKNFTFAGFACQENMCDDNTLVYVKS